MLAADVLCVPLLSYLRIQHTVTKQPVTIHWWQSLCTPKPLEGWLCLWSSDVKSLKTCLCKGNCTVSSPIPTHPHPSQLASIFWRSGTGKPRENVKWAFDSSLNLAMKWLLSLCFMHCYPFVQQLSRPTTKIPLAWRKNMICTHTHRGVYVCMSCDSSSTIDLSLLCLSPCKL